MRRTRRLAAGPSSTTRSRRRLTRRWSSLSASSRRAAHASAHGDPPRRLVMGSTTDARFYLNQFSRPALAYGPKARNIHAVDEAVELASIVHGAQTLARFVARFFAAG